MSWIPQKKKGMASLSPVCLTLADHRTPGSSRVEETLSHIPPVTPPPLWDIIPMPDYSFFLIFFLLISTLLLPWRRG